MSDPSSCPACLNGCGGARSDCPMKVDRNPPQRKLGGATGKGFLPGKSGNPGGMPKGVGDVKALARQHTPVAMEALVSIAGDPEKPPAARVQAATVILDRGWGKSIQPVDLNDKRPLSQVPAERLVAALEALAAAAKGEGEA